MSYEIIAVGKFKKDPLGLVFQTYHDRLATPLSVLEIDTQDPAQERQKILDRIKTPAFTIMLDERGQTFSSKQFAALLQKNQDQGVRLCRFVIGGAQGLDDTVRARADMLLSFGAQTWPHMMVRVMLAEQLYRAQQILAGHPYHKE